ncbi:MAG TPA: hypothetical protein V6C88_14455 [Chroococcidiopsis sp.]
MFNALSNAIFYHGWQIEIAAYQEEFQFRCYRSNFLDYSNDGLAYDNINTALMAAYTFIDREIAIHAILGIIGEWLLTDQINDEEYWNLTNFD